VGGWYDCGKVETILSTQSHLLRHGRARQRQGFMGDTTFVDPVRIEDGVKLVGACRIGPNVTIGKGSTLTRCTVSDAVVGDGVELTDCKVRGSLIGDGVRHAGQTMEHVVAAGEETAPAQ